MVIDEKIYSARRDVKYVLEKNIDSDTLLIIFSAFSPIGKPPQYNFMKSLSEFKCNKLFILDDFGSRGSYYLTVSEDDYIEQSVIELIQNVLDELNLKNKNVVTIGSSKGGYAALYYAIKYEFSEVIAGSPPFYIIDSLIRSNAYDILDIFSKSSSSLDEINFKLQNEILKASRFPKINLMVGNKEYHYFEHVKPMLDLFNNKDIKYNIDFKDFEKHNDLTKFFPSLIKNLVSERLMNLKINGVNIKKLKLAKGSEISFVVDCEGDELSYAWYLYKENEVIEKNWYTENNEITWVTKESGIFKIKIFIKNKTGNIVTKYTEPIEVI